MKESKKRLISLIGTSSITIAALVGITFAWFNTNKSVNASDINIDIEQNNQLAISLDYDDNYQYDISDSYAGDSFAQLSGDGVNFYTYTALLNDSNAYYISGFRQIAESEYEKSLYYREIYFRTDFPINLYWGKDSFLSPVSTTLRKIHGIAKDYVAGAMRVSLAKKDSEGNIHPLLVWAPNSQYEFDEEANTMKTNGTVESEYKILRGTTESNALTVQTNGAIFGNEVVSEQGYIIPTFMWGTPTVNQLVTSLDAGVTSMIFAVWLEGTDRECVSTLSGGHVKLSIKLSSEVINN